MTTQTRKASMIVSALLIAVALSFGAAQAFAKPVSSCTGAPHYFQGFCATQQGCEAECIADPPPGGWPEGAIHFCRMSDHCCMCDI